MSDNERDSCAARATRLQMGDITAPPPAPCEHPDGALPRCRHWEHCASTGMECYAFLVYLGHGKAASLVRSREIQAALKYRGYSRPPGVRRTRRFGREIS